MEIKQAAEKEVRRIQKILPSVKAKSHGNDLLDFAMRYGSDAEFFLKKEKYLEAFEAAIIAWAYLDVGLKLNLLFIPDSLKKHFTA